LEPIISIAVLNTRELNVSTYFRSYELKSGVSHSINGNFSYEKLPDAGMHRATLYMEVTSTSELEGTQVIAMTCSSTVEAVVAIENGENLTAEELTDLMAYKVGPSLLGQIRVNLAQASQMTGLSPVVLPALDPGMFKSIMLTTDEVEGAEAEAV
jgi:hypothetical protein